MLKKKELIEKFNLIKTKTKCYFYDGRNEHCRVLYTDKHGEFFVFYNNDLHTVDFYMPIVYEEDIEAIDGKLGAGYSWYH
jgi:hypothetical protein